MICVGNEVTTMFLLKEKSKLQNRKNDADQILLHIRNIILDEKHRPEELPELVEAYANLLDVSLDME